MRGAWLAVLMPLMACDDYIRVEPPGPDISDKSGWCAVREVIPADCYPCHNAASALGSLDLQTDPHGALVGAAAATNPQLTLVVAGDPDASFLMNKLHGDLTPNQGGIMPPEGKLDDDVIEVFRAWIADGADSVCSDVLDTDVQTTAYHPIGYWMPIEHGTEAKQQDQACTDCHGADLTGLGDAPSCDACHQDGWRTDCTFCHGDPVEGSGAPPVHISGADDGQDASFIPHMAHVSDSSVKDGFACSACHSTPTDILSDGHLFVGDATPGVAETDFGQSLSDAAVWDPATGACSNLYCHGNRGRDNGLMSHAGSVGTCHDCHPDRTSGESAWEDRFVGERHKDHLKEGIQCAACHSTATASTGIAIASQHVNGVVEVVLAEGTMTRNPNGTCTGNCHGEGHSNESW